MDSWQEVDAQFNKVLDCYIACIKSARESAQYAELANKLADGAEAQAHEARVRLKQITKKALLFKAGGVN